MTATGLRYPFPWTPVMEMPEVLRELRKDPVVEVTLPSGDTALLVTRYNDVRALFVDKRLSRNIAQLGAARISANNQLLMDHDVDVDSPMFRGLNYPCVHHPAGGGTAAGGAADHRRAAGRHGGLPSSTKRSRTRCRLK